MFLTYLDKAAVDLCHLDRNKPIIVGVSGGADSLALMHGLYTLNFSLVIAHLDHAIRADSQADADYVETVAAEYQLLCIRKRVDVPKMAREQGLSLEEAAREARYQFLFEQAGKHNVQAVAVAHHADDQVETVLMHLIRGAALDGLSGMPYLAIENQWSQDIPVARPLLGIWREDIESYLENLGISPCIDETNEDTTYFRNLLRHRLIPEVEKLNPQFRKVLRRSVDVLGEENQYLSEMAEGAWSECVNSHSDQLVRFDRKVFNRLPKALKRRMMRKAISQLRPGLRDIGYDAIEHGLTFITGDELQGEIDLVAKLNLAILEDEVVLKPWNVPLPDMGKPQLPIDRPDPGIDAGDEVHLESGWVLKTELLALPFEEFRKKIGEILPCEVYLDYESLVLPLKIRGRKPGERWRPIGMDGHRQKLQDFFINQKIPAHLRDRWPLVVSGDEVAWVAGLKPSESHKVKPETRQVLYLELIQLDKH